jgi:peptidoglycan/LPS O-acetylase OafA/YrhL
MIFFAISGWLVGGGLLDKIGQRNAVMHYAIDRATRLWTVLIPTFGLTLLFGLATGVLRPGGIDVSASSEFSLSAFAGNLVGLQRVTVPDFGANYSLWTLGDQTWYYILFPLIVLTFAANRIASRAAAAATCLIVLALVPTIVLLYFSVWLMGVAFSRVRIDCSTAARCGWLFMLIAISLYIRLTGNLYDYDQTTLGMDIVFVLVFLPFVASLQFKPAAGSKLAPPIARGARFFASFSFSLYALHVPLITLLRPGVLRHLGVNHLSAGNSLHFAVYLGMLAALMGGSYLSHRLFESHTSRIRHHLKAFATRHVGAQRTDAAPRASKEEKLQAPAEGSNESSR